MYSLQMEGEITWKDYKDVASSCREQIRRTKAQLELGLRDNAKKFAINTAKGRSSNVSIIC